MAAPPPYTGQDSYNVILAFPTIATSVADGELPGRRCYNVILAFLAIATSAVSHQHGFQTTVTMSSLLFQPLQLSDIGGKAVEKLLQCHLCFSSYCNHLIGRRVLSRQVCYNAILAFPTIATAQDVAQSAIFCPGLS